MRSRQIPQGGSTAAPSFSLEAHFRFESMVLHMHKLIEPIDVDQIPHQCPRKDTGNASRRNNRETLRPLRWIFRGMSITHSEVQSIICSEETAELSNGEKTERRNTLGAYLWKAANLELPSLNGRARCSLRMLIQALSKPANQFFSSVLVLVRQVAVSLKEITRYRDVASAFIVTLWNFN